MIEKQLQLFPYIIFKNREIQYKNITNQDAYKIIVTK